ncbi:unnamed protein product [Durusdinium trenchii]|uniref:Amine oxidase domain-containing protein n=1 Tax=Durusdinium trenchii TaxID=1381693 RepID=A0ABP0HL92_9DINO
MSLAFVQPLHGAAPLPLLRAQQTPPKAPPADGMKSSSLIVGGAACAVAAGRTRRTKVLATESRTRTVNPATNEPEDPKDFPKPSCINETDNYKESEALTQKLMALKGKGESKTVAIIGGGLSGLACAKYLVDAGHKPIVLEARDCLGGKVSAWKDKDGDWVETGLHIFFGAYPNMMNLFSELDIEDRLQWKRHQMIFAMQELPGEFTTFDFLEGIPAPFNFGLSILLNQKMLTLPEKLQTAPALLPMLVEGQKFIDLQDELSVLNFMEKYGMPDRINTEVFIAMAKALDFIDPEKLSMTVVLTAMNRFLNETDGLQMAFIDGNQTVRLCEPLKEYIESRGGQVLCEKPLARIETNEDGSVKCFKLRNGQEVVADEYVSSVPCDIMKRILPRAWSTDPFFRQIDELEGIPVINIHLWMGKSDEEIVAATMKELERLFPTEIGEHLPDGGAKLLKHAVVKVPRSVYAAIPGRNKFRPSQETPIKNFTLAGDWTSQKFLGSMEGAILGGKLAAEVVACKAAGEPTKGLKEVDPSILAKKDTFVAKDPMGVKGKTPIAFGGGEVLGSGFVPWPFSFRLVPEGRFLGR